MNVNVSLHAPKAPIARKTSSTGPTQEQVLSVTHYTDNLFSFRITRPDAFRFRSGEFVMIGLMVDGKPLMRAYSIASPSWHDELEFFSIKVPDGPLTSRLQTIQVGDTVILSRKPVGTLVLDALASGENLYLFSTGTGFAPFASLIQDPETYDKFNRVIVTHTARHVLELEYSQLVIGQLMEHEFLGEMVQGKLYFFTTATRERYIRQGRITKFIENGDLFQMLALPELNPEQDRAMICGSNDMIQDTKELLINAGLTEGSNANPAEFVVEKSFVG